MDDRELLESIRRNDPGAFEAFVGRYGDRLFGFGVRMCGEREDAREVVQETFLKAFTSLGQLQAPEALRSWVFRVAANACLMKRRRGRFEPEREISLEELLPDRGGGGSTQIPDAASMPDAELDRTRLRERVRAAVEALPPHYRIVLVLRDMEQMSTREVAAILDLPETTVKMRLHRARLMVRSSLEEGATGSTVPPRREPRSRGEADG